MRLWDSRSARQAPEASTGVHLCEKAKSGLRQTQEIPPENERKSLRFHSYGTALISVH